MTPYERLATAVRWNLRHVKAKDVFMKDIRTCRLGHSADCPALNHEGLSRMIKMTEPAAVALHGEIIPGPLCTGRRVREFFGLNVKWAKVFFGPYCTGTKTELRQTWEDYQEYRAKHRKGD